MVNRKFLTVTLAILFAQTTLLAQTSRPAHIGLVYPLSTNGREAKRLTNSFSLHAIAGVSRAETGVALAGVSLVILDTASGLQCAGFSNHIGHSAHGVRLAGFTNLVDGKAEGFQAAGFLNRSGSSKGASIAGFANICRDSSRGAQVAGFINRSGDAGTQIAGFINVARKVKGVQIGFINIADSSEYPIALISIIRNGEKSVGISADETLTTLVTFRSGSRRLYGIMGLGYNGKDKDPLNNKDRRDLYAWEAGLGAHLNFTNSFRINVEATTLGLTDFKSGGYFRASIRALPALRFGHHFELFAGPSFNYMRSEKDKGASLVTHYVWSEKEGSGLFHGLYFGMTGGINIIL